MKNTAEAIVHVVDDDAEVRRSLRWLLESIDLAVQTHASAEEFLEHYDPDQPGCVVLDVRMPGMDGLELQQCMSERSIALPIIMVSAYADVPMATRAMKNGAVIFIEKPYHDQVLLEHIQEALKKDAERRGRERRQVEIGKRIASLTPREKEVLELMITGMSSREMAEDLGISHKTVDIHRAHINKKMQVGSMAELVRLVMIARGAAVADEDARGRPERRTPGADGGRRERV